MAEQMSKLLPCCNVRDLRAGPAAPCFGEGRIVTEKRQWELQENMPSDGVLSSEDVCIVFSGGSSCLRPN